MMDRGGREGEREREREREIERISVLLNGEQESNF
jgi:hypothetical protein